MVDDADEDYLSQFRWSLKVSGSNMYARRWILGGNGKFLPMHREIMCAYSGIQVDHIDGNTLNNQRSNLRLATPSQNQWNKGLYKNNTSGFKGVSWHKDTKRWQATIAANGKQKSLGVFYSKQDAALAYKEAAAKLHGEFTCTERENV